MNALIVSISLLVFAVYSHTNAQSIRVTLLGTGCPAPVMNRFGPSILVEAGEEKFIFDAGRGAIQRLTQAKVGFRDIRAVFLTHLHSDHIVGFPDLWLTGWVNGQRNAPLLLFGPKGTEAMAKYLRKAYEYDINTRLTEDRSPPQGVVVNARDIVEGIVYERNGVKVIAFEVDHRPTAPAFGYKVTYGKYSVAFSGDTKPSENLVKYTAGVDVLVHEVVSEKSLKERGRGHEWERMIVSHHTTAKQAGEIFSRVKPKLAVYSHIVLPSADTTRLLEDTHSAYSGRIVVGEDLMTIEIGDEIKIGAVAAGATNK